MVILTTPTVEVTYTEWSMESVESYARTSNRIFNERYKEKRLQSCRDWYALPQVKEYRKHYEESRKEQKKIYRHEYYLKHRQDEINQATQWNKDNKERRNETRRKKKEVV